MAFGAFQFLALPFVLYRDAAGWECHPETLAELSLTAVLAYLAFCRLSIALVVLGLLGAWRAITLVIFVVRILTGHTNSAEDPGAFFALLLTDIAAVFWLIGAASAIKGSRQSSLT